MFKREMFFWGNFDAYMNRQYSRVLANISIKPDIMRRCDVSTHWFYIKQAAKIILLDQK